MSSEDEEAVEAELNELINIEHQKAVDLLPTVPSDDLPVSDPGNFLNSVFQYYVLTLFSYLVANEEEKLPSKKIAVEAQ